MKFLKVGRVAIITHGRYAGKKVRSPSDSSSFSTRFPSLSTTGTNMSGVLATVRDGKAIDNQQEEGIV